MEIRRSTTGHPDLPTEGFGVYSGTNQSCSDTGLVNGTRDYYSAFVLSTTNEWGPKSTASGTPSTDTTPPANPTNLSAQAGVGRVVLSWTNPSDADFVRVTIVRKAGSAPATLTDGTQVYSGGLLGYADSTGVTNGTTYYYRAYAIDASDNASPGVAASRRRIPARAARRIRRRSGPPDRSGFRG